MAQWGGFEPPGWREAVRAPYQHTKSCHEARPRSPNWRTTAIHYASSAANLVTVFSGSELPSLFCRIR